MCDPACDESLSDKEEMDAPLSGIQEIEGDCSTLSISFALSHFLSLVLFYF